MQEHRTKEYHGVVVITDLDGTLLDHATYSFEEALPALALLKAKVIPLVLCTSKTRGEVEWWRRELGNEHPYIVENGGAVFVPGGYFNHAVPGAVERGGSLVVELGAPHAELVESLRQAASETGAAVRGFSQMSVAEVSEYCQLNLEQAALAKLREYDEPYLLLEPEKEEELVAAIQRRGRRWTRGGRFHHILGNSDKERAVRILLELYRRENPEVLSVGLGDGLNDAPFLNAVDSPILLRSGWIDQLQALVPRGRPTIEGGPRGWNRAILDLLG